MADALKAFAAKVAEQVHGDILEAVGSGELPEGAADSVGAHKYLVAMHIINGYRENVGDGDLDYDHIEAVARRASENAIAA